MRINLNSGQPRNTIINAARVNASFAKYSPRGRENAKGSMRSDRATFSPQGKLMSMVDNLTKQKQSIIERKNDLVESTLKNGGKMDDIKDQLKNYSKQMSDIDKQIASLYAQQAKDAVQQDDKKKTGKPDPNKTQDQLEVERLSNLANVSDGIESAEKITSVKERIEGEVRVKQAELGQGELHVDVLESKGLDGARVQDMIDNEMSTLSKQEKEISALQDQVSQLGQSQGKSLKETVDELEEQAEQEKNQMKEKDEE